MQIHTPLKGLGSSEEWRVCGLAEKKEGLVEFKWLDSKLVGSDTVIFRLEDGALVKIKVDVDRAGVAVNYVNADGSPHYHIDTSLKVTVIPPKRKFYVPKSRLPPVSSKRRGSIVV